MTIFAECWLLPYWLLPGWLGAELPELLAPALRMTRIPLGSNTSSLSTYCCSTHFLGGPPRFDGRLWGSNPPVKCTGCEVHRDVWEGAARPEVYFLAHTLLPLLASRRHGQVPNLVKGEGQVD